MDATQLAQGGGMPPQQQPQQAPMQAVPGQVQSSDPRKILQALEAAIQQAVNGQGYVDLNKLVLLWPQISKQFGINIPFQSVMQMIHQNPQMIEDIINKMGLAGVIANGQVISASQLVGMGTGAQ